MITGQAITVRVFCDHLLFNLASKRKDDCLLCSWVGDVHRALLRVDECLLSYLDRFIQA